MKDYPALSEFYDDMRVEIGGRFTFVGSYPTTMEHRVFPTPPGKFCIRNIVICGAEDQPGKLAFRLTLDGKELFKTSQSLTDVPREKLPDSKMFSFHGIIVLEGFSFPHPGVLESFVSVDDNDWQRSGWSKLIKKTA